MPLHDTRGAASATGFGFGSSGDGAIANYGDYMIVPYTPDASANVYSEIAFYNVVTNQTTKRIAISGTYTGGSSQKIMRFGNYLFIMYNVYGLGYAVYNITTGAFIQSGIMGYLGEEGDVVKFGNNKIAGIVKNGTALRVQTYNIDLTTGVISFIAAFDFTSAFNGATTGFNSPQCAASINMDADALFSSYNGWITGNAVNSYISYQTSSAWFSFMINDAGTSASSFSKSTTTQNFSRPSGATGDLGRTCIYGFDGSTYVIFNQSSQGSYNSGTFVDQTNQAAIGINGQQSFLAMKNNIPSGVTEIYRLTPSVKVLVNSFTFSSYDRNAYIGQMFRDGAVVMIQNNTGTYGAPVLYRYNQYSENFGSAVTPNGLSTGRVNPQGRVVRIYNF
jgi:hypothetical protein